MTALALFTIPLRLFRRNRGHHASPRLAADERFADTDIRGRYKVTATAPERLPLTPLPAFEPRAYTLHAAPDVRGTCHCGRPAGHIQALVSAPEGADIDGEFSTQQFGAVRDG